MQVATKRGATVNFHSDTAELITKDGTTFPIQQHGRLYSASVPQGSVLGPLFFLVYINDLVENVSSNAKLFADDTSLFTVVYDEGIAADQLNRDLKIISDWAYQWKMQFNPDKNKEAIQVIFSQKRTKPVHPHIFLNESEVKIKDKQKHLGMVLDSHLNFNSHV